MGKFITHGCAVTPDLKIILDTLLRPLYEYAKHVIHRMCGGECNKIRMKLYHLF